MSAHAAAEHPARRAPRARSAGLSLPRIAPDAAVGLGLAVVIAVIAFGAKGGLALGSVTSLAIGFTLAAGLALAATLALTRTIALPGGSSSALLFALAGWTALSVAWSVQPADSWQEAARTFGYAGAFVLAALAARLAPRRWPAVLGAVIASGVAIAGYGVLTKVFPGSLDAADVYSRLLAPFDYWNATGLTAAMTAIACLWLGTRRSGHAALNALAYPLLALMLVAIMLAYSRGALLALAVGVALWLVLVPRRLRSAAVLLCAGAGAAIVVVWYLRQYALTHDSIALAVRSHSGRELGVILLVVLLALAAAGLVVGFFADRNRPRAATRRRAGLALIGCVCALLLAGIGVLAVSHRGLFGSVSHAVHTLTSTQARLPNNGPGRLTALSSVRAEYWSEAGHVFSSHPWVGVGAGGYATARLIYRNDPVVVRHAHGYVVQTLADLGIVGLLVSLALAGLWLAAAIRRTHPFAELRALRLPPAERLRTRERLPYTPERVGLLALFAIVIVFGIHSLYDWTWFVPGNAIVALLCAGWLAGRRPGPAPASETAAAQGDRQGPRARTKTTFRALAARHGGWRAIDPLRGATAALVLVVALIAAWAEWQPLRSSDAAAASLVALGRGDVAAATSAVNAARSRDPLSVEPLFDLAVMQEHTGNTQGAQAALQQAVRLQPANPASWRALAEFDLATLDNPRQALADLRPALYLDPESTESQQDYVTIEAQLQPPGTTVLPPQPSTTPAAPGATPGTTAPGA